MPAVDDAALAEYLRRSAAELNNPVDYWDLSSSKIPTPDGTPLDAASADTRTDYANYRDEVQSYVDIGNGEVTARKAGTAPPAELTAKLAQQWDFAIRELIADRHMLADYLKQHYRGLIKEQQARIKDLQSDAEHQHKAFEAVKKAIEDTEYAEKWTSILLKIHEAYEAIEGVMEGEEGIDPALVTIEGANFAREQIYGTSKIIEEGVKNLGNYAVALELASAGYGSIAELNQAMASTMQQTQDASSSVAYYAEKLDRAKQWADD